MYKRIKEEKTVIGQIIRLYYRKHEGNVTLCLKCRELLDYAKSRLDRCRYGYSKPICKDCPILLSSGNKGSYTVGNAMGAP